MSDAASSDQTGTSDELEAALRALCMAPGIRSTDKRVAVAVLHLFGRDGAAPILPSRLAYALAISEARAIASLQRLIEAGLVRSIFVPDLPALTALWRPSEPDQWQEDGKAS